MDSVLRPRDIQARIRSGESPETVAAAAQTSIERIMTFASPVLAERAYVAQQAQKASVRRRTGDGAPGQLGAAVAEQLATQHVEIEDVEWDAWRREDGRWTLVAEYAAQSGPERAEFVYDAAGRYVTATDEQSRWLVGERVTADPGSGSGRLPAAPRRRRHRAGHRPPPRPARRPRRRARPGAADAVAPRPAPGGRAAGPRRAGAREADAPEAPGTTEAPAPAPEAPAARAVETPTAPDEITVDLTDLHDTGSSARGRSGRPARPARPARPMADADWMATQASERLSGPTPAAPATSPAPTPPAVASPEPASASSAAAVAPAPGDAEALFEVPAPTGASEPSDAGDAGTSPDAGTSAATEAEDASARPATSKGAKAAKSAKSGKGRAAIPSWDEIMFGSSSSD